MSDSATSTASVWVHLFDLHSAFRREDLADIAAQLAIFPVTPETAEHVSISGAYMFAIARLDGEPSEFAEMVKDSYAATYLSSYEALLDCLLEQSAGDHAGHKGTEAG